MEETIAEEAGTETTRPDGPVADERSPESANGKDSERESASEQRDAGEEGSQVAQAADRVGHEAAPPEDVKIVVSFRGGRATVGVQRPDSDPHIETFDDLDESRATHEVSAVLERARAKWDDNPRNPAFERPAPAARGSNRRGRGAAQEQQTLRLF